MASRQALAALIVAVAALSLLGACRTGGNTLDMDTAMETRQAWVAGHFPSAWDSDGEATPAYDEARLPFSFVYDGVLSGDYLAGLTVSESVRQLDEDRSERTLTWSDAATGLETRCVVVEYADNPAVEWTVYFRNSGTQRTPILSFVNGMDIAFRNKGDEEFVLHGIKGDFNAPDSYEPYSVTLGPRAREAFAPVNGKSTGGPKGWPYYNLQFGEGGVIIAVGWPGQWASSFARDRTDGLRVTAGQETTRLYLEPGEEIRTPLSLLLFWEGGDVVDAQNMWRRWFREHNTPRNEDGPPPPMTFVGLGAFEHDQEIMWQQAGNAVGGGIVPDLFWKDAGWYPHFDGPVQGGLRWTNTGTWAPDPERFPDGFRPFSDWAHEQGAEFLLWFEPERVGDPDSYLGREHPDWLIHGAPARAPAYGQTYFGPILNLGKPEALEWLIDYMDGMIDSQGLDWYRLDMNGPGPLPAWRNADAPDRQGITENLYVQGLLAFYDELLARNPGLRIDNCASGGRRNDLEMMRRSVPLLRSDYMLPPSQANVYEANQSHTHGLSSWFPYYGSGVLPTTFSQYEIRSFYMPVFAFLRGFGTDEYINKVTREYYEECKSVAPLMLGDYYPLTPHTLEMDTWIAWQFNRPEEGDGMVQAFRRPKSEETAMTFRIRGLDPAATYDVTDHDAGSSVRMSGRDLASEGLMLEIKLRPGSALIVYRMVEDRGGVSNGSH